MELFGCRTRRGLGIDISTDAVRAVELLAHPNSYAIASVGAIQLAKKLVIDDEITDLEALGIALNRLRKQTATKVKQVVAAVPGSQVISKQLFMAADLNDAAISTQIETEAEALIPFPIAEVSYDFESLGEHASMLGQQRVLLTATRTMSVDSRVQALEKAGFKTQIIAVDNQAILRACDHLLPHLAPEISASPQPILILDVSCSALKLIVIQHGEVIFSRYQSGGLADLLETIDNNDNYDDSQLMAKLRADQINAITPFVLDDFLASIAAQVSRGIEIFQGNRSDNQLTAIVVINIGATIPALLTAVAKSIQLPVIALNPFEHFRLPAQLADYHDQGPLFVVAVGLALRSFVPWHR